MEKRLELYNVERFDFIDLELLHSQIIPCIFLSKTLDSFIVLPTSGYFDSYDDEHFDARLKIPCRYITDCQLKDNYELLLLADKNDSNILSALKKYMGFDGKSGR